LFLNQNFLLFQKFGKLVHFGLLGLNKFFGFDVLGRILGINQGTRNKNSDSCVDETPGNGKNFGHGKAIVLL
jgi:hypothetical protein